MEEREKERERENSLRCIGTPRISGSPLTVPSVVSAELCIILFQQREDEKDGGKKKHPKGMMMIIIVIIIFKNPNTTTNKRKPMVWVDPLDIADRLRLAALACFKPPRLLLLRQPHRVLS